MRSLLLATVLALGATSPALSDPKTVPPPTVKLLSAGKGPQRALRFAPKKGLKQSMTMTMELGIAMGMGKAPGTMIRTPPIKTVLDLVVTDVKTTGDFRYDFKTSKVTVVPKGNKAMVDAMKQEMKGIEGTTGYAVMTSRGFAVETDVNAPANASAQLKQTLEQMRQQLGQISAPLPEEPIGVGAKWETKTVVTSNGVSLDQAATYEVLKLAKDKVTLKVAIQQSAGPQTVTTNGATVKILSMKGSGGGTTALDLAKIAPPKAALKSTSSMEAEVAQGQTMGMSFEIKVDLASK